jgi:hypothetical protein
MLTNDAAARRIVELETKLHQERMARMKAEQTAAGRKSLILRLQAQIAAHKAREAAAKADDAT